MQENSLVGKVALITGAARRIGAEIAHTLHDEGMNIALHYNLSEDEATQLCKQLNQQRKHSAMSIHADLQETGSEQLLIQKVVDTWQRLDVLVNNASRFYRTVFGKITDYAWGDLMNSNLKAPFFLAQAAAPFLAASQGCVINLTDINADCPLRDFSVYCISKGALIMMTKVLAKELGPQIRVNAIAPGAILWPEGDNQLSEAKKQQVINRTALLRSGHPKDIAKAVVFFVRDAGYVTGQVLAVEGGRMLC